MGVLSDDHEIEDVAEEASSINAAATPDLRSAIPTLDESLASVRKSATEYTSGSRFAVFNSSAAHTTTLAEHRPTSSQESVTVIDSDISITSSRSLRSGKMNAPNQTTHTGRAILGKTSSKSLRKGLVEPDKESPSSGRRSVRQGWKEGVGQGDHGNYERTPAQELYHRQIGLLGEVFVGVLSCIIPS